MKTAVSLPDPVFHEAEKLARHLRMSRSQLYAEAIAEYTARHAVDDVRDTLDAVVAGIDDDSAQVVTAVAARTLRKVEW